MSSTKPVTKAMAASLGCSKSRIIQLPVASLLPVGGPQVQQSHQRLRRTGQ